MGKDSIVKRWGKSGHSQNTIATKHISRKKIALTPKMREDLDWERFEGAYKSQTHGTKTFLTKIFMDGFHVATAANCYLMEKMKVPLVASKKIMNIF
jgi:hypothetical protein